MAWLPQVRKKASFSAEGKSTTSKLVWKSRLAWQIAIFMGLQSLFFYSLAAWLPAILQNWRMEADRAGWMLSYIQMAQMPVMLVGPIVAAKMKDQTPVVWAAFALLMVGLPA